MVKNENKLQKSVSKCCVGYQQRWGN